MTFDAGKPEAVTLDEFSLFEEFSRRELPRLVRNVLEVIVDNVLEEHVKKGIEERLKSQLGDLVRDCQAKLLPLYRGRQSHQPPPLSLPRNPNIIDQDTRNSGDHELDSHTWLSSAINEGLSRFYLPPPPTSSSLAGPDLEHVRRKAPMHAGSASSGPSKSLSDSGYASTAPGFLITSIGAPPETRNLNHPFGSLSEDPVDPATNPDQHTLNSEDPSSAWPYAGPMDEPHICLNGFFDIQSNPGMSSTSQFPLDWTTQSLPIGNTFENCEEPNLNVHALNEGGFELSMDASAGQFIDQSNLLEKNHEDEKFRRLRAFD
jgi:hypothetical protein